MNLVSWKYAMAGAALISVAPWIATLLILPSAKSEDTEGALMLLTLVGAISFSITGPIAICAASLRPGDIRCRLSMWFFGASLPTLLFQCIATSASVIAAFTWFPLYQTSSQSMVEAIDGLFALVVYAVMYLALSAFVSAGRWATIAASAVIGVCLSAVVLIRMFV